MFWHQLDRILALARPHRLVLSLLIDGLVIAAAWNFTYLFRLGFDRWLSARPGYDLWVMLGAVAVYLLVFMVRTIPRGMWRFSGFREVQRLGLACMIAGSLVAVAVLMGQLSKIPRSVLVLHPLMALMGLCIVRMLYRMLYEHMRTRMLGGSRKAKRAIVLGAGDAARWLLPGLHQDGWTVLGLLDDDPAKHGARVLGSPVLGSLDDLKNPKIKAGATHVITAMPGASFSQRRRAINLATESGLKVMTVPSIAELKQGGVEIERIRAIEPEDLLGREAVTLDEAGVAAMISGKTVLVTGAGGSIGSELCRQIARYGPARLVLYELSELALYQIEQQLGELHPHLPLTRLMGDVKDLTHLRRTFEAHRPQLVFHAAAFKHVPLMENDNAWAAVQNNILGTYHAAIAAAEMKAEAFVLISTDKAVNPSNVMGATKRAAEMVLSHLATQGHSTRFTAVRFGNVLGSSGSVIPKFKEQIAKGGPVTVTHPDITRYFMTISEASRLVLQAAALAETGQVYVLDMGEPIKIVQLARDMIRLSGRSEEEVPVVFTGLRPGEKLYEELLSDADRTQPCAHPRLRIAQLRQYTGDEWMRELMTWLKSDSSQQPPIEHRQRLATLVPEYNMQ